MNEKKGKVLIKSHLDKGFYWEITNIKDVPIAISPKFYSTRQECQEKFYIAWKEISSIVTYGFEETLTEPTEIDIDGSRISPAPMNEIAHGAGKIPPTLVNEMFTGSGKGRPKVIDEE